MSSHFLFPATGTSWMNEPVLLSFDMDMMALFGWLTVSQSAVLFSHANSVLATSYQPVSSIFLSQ
jgi:hypothetical protein